MGNYPPHYAYPSSPPLVRVYPDPPRLHWGVVFGLSFVTFGLFGMVWLVVMAWWAKRVTGSSRAFGWSLAYLLFIPGMFVLGIMAGVVAMIGHMRVQDLTGPLEGLARIAALVLYIAAAYTLRGELEGAPIHIPLSGVMTFFFSATYFQYHLHDFHWDESSGVPVGAAPVEGVLGLRGPMAPIVNAERGPIPAGARHGENQLTEG